MRPQKCDDEAGCLPFVTKRLVFSVTKPPNRFGGVSFLRPAITSTSEHI